MFLPLKEYLNIAERMLYGRLTPVSEDDISFVAEYMMRADSKFKEGMGDRAAFRGHCGKFGVMALLSQKKKKRKRVIDTVSLDCFLTQDETLRNIECIPDRREKEPWFKLQFQEILDHVNNSTSYSDKQRKYFNEYISHGCNTASMARSLEISYFSVDQVIKQVFRKLSDKYVQMD